MHYKAKLSVVVLALLPLCFAQIPDEPQNTDIESSNPTSPIPKVREILQATTTTNDPKPNHPQNEVRDVPKGAGGRPARRSSVPKSEHQTQDSNFQADHTKYLEYVPEPEPSDAGDKVMPDKSEQTQTRPHPESDEEKPRTKAPKPIPFDVDDAEVEEEPKVAKSAPKPIASNFFDEPDEEEIPNNHHSKLTKEPEIESQDQGESKKLVSKHTPDRAPKDESQIETTEAVPSKHRQPKERSDPESKSPKIPSKSSDEVPVGDPLSDPRAIADNSEPEASASTNKKPRPPPDSHTSHGTPAGNDERPDEDEKKGDAPEPKPHPHLPLDSQKDERTIGKEDSAAEKKPRRGTSAGKDERTNEKEDSDAEKKPRPQVRRDADESGQDTPPHTPPHPQAQSDPRSEQTDISRSKPTRPSEGTAPDLPTTRTPERRSSLAEQQGADDSEPETVTQSRPKPPPARTDETPFENPDPLSHPERVIPHDADADADKPARPAEPTKPLLDIDDGGVDSRPPVHFDVSELVDAGDNPPPIAPNPKPKPSCERHVTCSACVQDPSCGFCGATRQCMTGTPRNSVVHVCSAGWSFERCVEEPRVVPSRPDKVVVTPIVEDEEPAASTSLSTSMGMVLVLLVVFFYYRWRYRSTQQMEYRKLEPPMQEMGTDLDYSSILVDDDDKHGTQIGYAAPPTAWNHGNRQGSPDIFAAAGHDGDADTHNHPESNTAWADWDAEQW